MNSPPVASATPRRGSGSPVPLALVTLLAAAIPTFIFRGFTVDDALIIARYAHHLATGSGYRFNRLGPITDGVTPLGLPYLLAPWSSGGTWAALLWGRRLGALAWIASASALGWRVSAYQGRVAPFVLVALIVCNAPLAAWGIAGMETGLVTCLVTLAACAPATARGSYIAALGVGLAAWGRPELLPYAVLSAFGRSTKRGSGTRSGADGWSLASIAACPWLAEAFIRWWIFGRPTPLSLLAKPSDLSHGWAYMASGALLTGVPACWMAPWGFRRLGRRAKWILVASAAHAGVLVLVGGDWMPVSRLWVPVLPPLFLVVAELASSAKWPLLCGSVALGLAGELWTWTRVLPAATHVLDVRSQIIEASAPRLRGAMTIAAIDIGWLGGATDATIVDLAGVTDPEIAALPGGHTSKQISAAALLKRAPDLIVFLEADPPHSRIIELRLSRNPLLREYFAPAWQTPANLPIRYAVWGRRESSTGGTSAPPEDPSKRAGPAARP